MILTGKLCRIVFWDCCLRRQLADMSFFRFAIATMERFFLGGSSGSLPENVSLARSACKLRYIVGCAPVCYGIPVTFNNPASS